MKAITSFTGSHRFLSNFYQYPFEYKGLVYPNSEAAFQAQKCAADEDKIKYTQITNPVRVKQLGRREPNLPSDWDERAYDIMKDVLSVKFAIPELKEMLLATEDAELVEGNHWHDNRWGRCSCERCKQREALNWLGKILMEIREEARKI